MVPVDLDGDGLIDFQWANDTVPNFVFHNLGYTGSRKSCRLGHCLRSPPATPTGRWGSMPPISATTERWASPSAISANEMSSLYVSQGRPLQFADEAIATVGPPSRQWLKFGTIFFDYDSDGRPGFADRRRPFGAGHRQGASQPAATSSRRSFWNCGPGSKTEFVAVPPEQCAPTLFVRSSAEAAVADIDGDGDLRHCAHVGRRPASLAATTRSWAIIGSASADRHALEPRCDRCPRRPTGRPGIAANRDATRGYLSQSEPPVTFGVGNRTAVKKVTIHWPGGGEQDVPRQ